MPLIALFIPDAILRSAVAEQLQGAALGDLQEGGDLSALLTSNEVAAIILDANADKNIFKTLRTLAPDTRKKRLFILSDGSEKDDNLAFEYFEKPLRLGYLLARVQFFLQTALRRRSDSIVLGSCQFEAQERRLVVRSGGVEEVIRLTEKETALLDYLAHSIDPVSREELLAAIWGYDARIDTHTLETHIYQLRQKLASQGGADWLRHEEGGYRLMRT